jgi:hypothetical protein
MFESVPIVASKTVEGEIVRAEFFGDTGRLRIIGGTVVRAEWFPPHSWFAIATVSGHSGWGRGPTKMTCCDSLTTSNTCSNRD